MVTFLKSQHLRSDSCEGQKLQYECVNNRKYRDVIFQTLDTALQRVSYFMCLGLNLRFCLFLQLTQITRTGQCTWDSKNILAVSFAPLVQQSRADGDKPDTVHLREFR